MNIFFLFPAIVPPRIEVVLSVILMIAITSVGTQIIIVIHF